MKFIILILIFEACTTSQAISVRQSNQLKMEPVGVTEDHSNGLPSQDKMLLVKADERLGLWRTEKGDLVKMIPFVGEIDQEPVPSHVHSFVRKRQDSLGINTKPLCDLAEHGSNSISSRSMMISPEQPGVVKEGTRAGRTIWPFTNWFYDPYYDDPYYPPPPIMPYPPFPSPFGPPPLPMYPPGPW